MQEVIDRVATATEQWRSIPGAEGYDVSSFGRVRSWRGNKAEPRYLSTAATTKGYAQVCLRVDDDDGNGARNYYVHHLVLELFVGPRPEGYIARHRDDNKLNNRLDNLVWMPQSDQYARGEDHPNAKLSERQVQALRDAYACGTHVEEIAEMYDISPNYVYILATGDKTWAHLGKPDIERPRNSERVRGASHTHAVLTDADIREMRRLWATGEWSQVDLARRFSTDNSNVSRIVRGQHWTHILSIPRDEYALVTS